MLDSNRSFNATESSCGKNITQQKFIFFFLIIIITVFSLSDYELLIFVFGKSSRLRKIYSKITLLADPIFHFPDQLWSQLILPVSCLAWKIITVQL